MEPDFGNAGYWFQRVGIHPIFGQLAERAEAISQGSPDANWRVPEPWNPSTFLDLCEDAIKRKGSKRHLLAVAIQTVEWQLLFDWCAAKAAR
jgi:hypothetical protein